MNFPEQFSLAGKTAIVTGCKRGIGKALAVALAEAGADISLVFQHRSSYRVVKLRKKYWH
jgi:NAD(P)-dependent dehydrogenase (short-subunit alcohol dehydrogenase family)